MDYDFLSSIDPVTFPPRIAQATALDRRGFLKLGALVGGGLALALYLPSVAEAAEEAAPSAAPAEPEVFAPSLFVRIRPDGHISLLATNPECGQGVKTSLPMLIAEELDAPWDKLEIVQSGFDQRLGRQAAGGSGATPAHFEQFRRLGATARSVLVAAAAARWSVPAAELTTPGDATVAHTPSGRSATYGELATAAAKLPVPDEKAAPLKDPSQFRLLGKRIPGVDNPRIVTGAPLFGIDVRRPGQLFASILKCPVHGGTVRTAKLDAVRSAPGVKAAFELKAPGVTSSVAIVAATTWQAWQARRLALVEWDEGRTAGNSTAGFSAGADKAFADGTGGKVTRDEGDVEAALSAPGVVKVEARYAYPFIAHANLEPQNCTALYADGRLELWAPTQAPQGARDAAARAAGLKPEQVTVNMTRIGGGFGRRLNNDYAAEVAAIAKEMPGTPIQLVWDRADDMQHDYYRAGGFHGYRGAVDAEGRVTAWHEHFVTFSGGHDSKDPGSSASLAQDEFPSKLVPNTRIRQDPLPSGIPLGPWRAPRTSAQCFAQQSFLDELAHAAGKDPVEFRLTLLGEPRVLSEAGRRGPAFNTGRMAGVVRAAARISGWGTALPKGTGRGIAFQFSHRGYVAVVVQVTVTPAGTLTIDHVWAAVDVGRQIVNLSGAENQAEGSIVDGISTSLQQAITFTGGRTDQTGFADMPLLRITEAPKRISVHFELTDNPVTGLGEPVIPPVPPALGNALFAATGKRIRTLPFNATSLAWG